MSRSDGRAWPPPPGPGERRRCEVWITLADVILFSFRLQPPRRWDRVYRPDSGEEIDYWRWRATNAERRTIATLKLAHPEDLDRLRAWAREVRRTLTTAGSPCEPYATGDVRGADAVYLASELDRTLDELAE